MAVSCKRPLLYMPYTNSLILYILYRDCLIVAPISMQPVANLEAHCKLKLREPDI